MRLLTAVSLVRVQQGELKKQHRSKRPVFSSGNANPVRGMSAFTVITWLRGQAVKTSPFHGGNTGSIPVGVIYHSDNRSIVAKRMIKLCILFYYV